MLLYKLRFAWWNTGLSPASNSAKSKANPETSKRTCEHIARLFLDYECDFLALCEVSEEDVAYIKAHLGLDDVVIIGMTDKIARSRFDVCVLYNTKKFGSMDYKNLIVSYMGSNIKAGQVLEIENKDDNEVFRIYLCHWSSRINPTGEENRKKSALRIYDDIQDYFNKKGLSNVIVMGDFNDNPYDYSLMNNLKSSRCLDSVRKYPKDLLYNPFWRSVVPSIVYSHVLKNPTFNSGSYKFENKEGVSWHSFDQIFLSGSFLGHSKWHLNESNTSVLACDNFLNDFENKDCHIDHMPVISEVLRV